MGADFVFQLIQTVIVVLITGGFIVLLALMFFYRGTQKRITVVKKRISSHGGLNSWRSKWTYCEIYTVDCKYDNSRKIHTLRCSKMHFDMLKENKEYEVKIKLREIIKVKQNLS